MVSRCRPGSIFFVLTCETALFSRSQLSPEIFTRAGSTSSGPPLRPSLAIFSYFFNGAAELKTLVSFSFRFAIPFDSVAVWMVGLCVQPQHGFHSSLAVEQTHLAGA